MSNFTHYNSDPLIAAAAAILEGKQIETTSITEANIVNVKLPDYPERWYKPKVIKDIEAKYKIKIQHDSGVNPIGRVQLKSISGNGDQVSSYIKDLYGLSKGSFVKEFPSLKNFNFGDDDDVKANKIELSAEMKKIAKGLADIGTNLSKSAGIKLTGKTQHDFDPNDETTQNIWYDLGLPGVQMSKSNSAPLHLIVNYDGTVTVEYDNEPLPKFSNIDANKFNKSTVEKLKKALGKLVESDESIENAPKLDEEFIKKMNEKVNKKYSEDADTLAEADAYSVVKEIEKQLKDVKGHFKNFHDGYEEDALEEIMGTLSYCTTLAKKAQKLL